MAALCFPCTAAVASSAASDSRRINTVHSLPTIYNTVYSIPSTGTYTVLYRFVVSSACAFRELCALVLSLLEEFLSIVGERE